ncbi:hypothetical protein [Prosthecobacter sp.]|jgi:hypothetical protein|uniref:hypothetical protein n=1 Tax=Prosthecobacter sp. TaxID=1965333 RepID=UPI0037CB1A62
MKSYFLNPQSDADGTQWTALGDVKCNSLTVVNNTGTELEFKIGSDAGVLRLKDGQGYQFSVLNASELKFRRVDQSNTQVTLYTVEAEAL